MDRLTFSLFLLVLEMFEFGAWVFKINSSFVLQVVEECPQSAHLEVDRAGSDLAIMAKALLRTALDFVSVNVAADNRLHVFLISKYALEVVKNLFVTPGGLRFVRGMRSDMVQKHLPGSCQRQERFALGGGSCFSLREHCAQQFIALAALRLSGFSRRAAGIFSFSNSSFSPVKKIISMTIVPYISRSDPLQRDKPPYSGGFTNLLDDPHLFLRYLHRDFLDEKPEFKSGAK